ncbi:MAG: hypothetical protein O2887_08065 [Bacteroidetes bacterium]|nr:hypothetical protein [Bacteroidota bacterium]MDA1120434.1 hypothetical protein [Bacteroidota bacterium]
MGTYKAPFQGIFRDEERLRVMHSSLVISVKSINQYFGTLEDFFEKHGKHWITNGVLLYTNEMSDPPPGLFQIIDDILLPNGLCENKDFVLLYEQLIYGIDGNVSPLLNGPIPEAEGIAWLGSVISKDGHFIWYTG